MRPTAPLLTVLALSLTLISAVHAAPSMEDLMGGEKDKSKAEKPQPRDVLRFNPHTVQSPTELLDAIYQVDWWITQSARKFEAEDARSEILAVHLNLLDDWLTGLDPEVIVSEERDAHFDPPITFTERVFLSWDVRTDSPDDWRVIRDLALDDLRLKRPERAIQRYREFFAGSEIVADPDQVLLFLRQIGAARLRSGGPAWRDHCLALYGTTSDALLTKHPQFMGMATYATRSRLLESLYEDPNVHEEVWRLRAILDLLTASGPGGYQTIITYWQSSDEPFLPYPEKIALDGGGLGITLLRMVLDDVDLTADQRKGLLAVALEHAQSPTTNSLAFPQELMTGRITLYPYAPEQRTWLEGQFRDYLVSVTDSAIDPPVIFPADGSAAKVPEFLRERAVLLLEFADPLAEVERLLASEDAQAKAIGLATMAMALEEASDFTTEEWIGTEATYLSLVQPYLHAGDRVLRDLALVVLLRLSRSPVPLEAERFTLTSTAIGLLIALQEEADPAYRDVPRIMALSMHRRGIALNQIRALVDSVDAYADAVDLSTLGLEASLELLSFIRALADPAQNPPNQPLFVFPILEPNDRQVLIAVALDRMTLFARFNALEPLIDDTEYVVTAGHPLIPELRVQLENLAGHRESYMLHPDVADRIDALLELQ